MNSEGKGLRKERERGGGSSTGAQVRSLRSSSCAQAERESSQEQRRIGSQ
jgi:hypothetical protein